MLNNIPAEAGASPPENPSHGAHGEMKKEKRKMNNRRASPAVSLTFMIYSDKKIAPVASFHVFFGTRQVFVLDF